MALILYRVTLQRLQRAGCDLPPESALADFFQRLNQLDQADPQVMLSMVQGQHPVRKMARLSVDCRQRRLYHPRY